MWPCLQSTNFQSAREMKRKNSIGKLELRGKESKTRMRHNLHAMIKEARGLNRNEINEGRLRTDVGSSEPRSKTNICIYMQIRTYFPFKSKFEIIAVHMDVFWFV